MLRGCFSFVSVMILLAVVALVAFVLGIFYTQKSLPIVISEPIDSIVDYFSDSTDSMRTENDAPQSPSTLPTQKPCVQPIPTRTEVYQPAETQTRKPIPISTEIYRPGDDAPVARKPIPISTEIYRPGEE